MHRADGSGDTVLFTRYLSATAPAWKASIGSATTVAWPQLPNANAYIGNPGMVEACRETKYSIAYVGISFLGQTDAAGLGYAALRNRAGRYVLPDASTIGAAANELVAETPKDERQSLVFAPGENSYPIVNFEYAVVNPHQAGEVAADVKDFLMWTISPDGGQLRDYLDQVHFIPLPANVAALSKAQIETIGAP